MSDFLAECLVFGGYGCYGHSRDNARTPMQWSDKENEGFTLGKPWLKVNPNYKEINVSEQQDREDSLLNYYKKLIALRKSDDQKDMETLSRYLRTKIKFLHINEMQIFVLANFGEEGKKLELEEGRYEMVLNNMEDLDISDGIII